MSSLATWRCEQCRKQVRGTKHRTMLGRTVCTACQQRFDAMALAGLMAQQQGVDVVANGIPDSIAISSARASFRRAIRRRP